MPKGVKMTDRERSAIIRAAREYDDWGTPRLEIARRLNVPIRTLNRLMRGRWPVKRHVERAVKR